MYINILYDIFRKKNNVILNDILLKVCHPQKLQMSSCVILMSSWEKMEVCYLWGTSSRIGKLTGEGDEEEAAVQKKPLTFSTLNSDF